MKRLALAFALGAASALGWVMWLERSPTGVAGAWEWVPTPERPSAPYYHGADPTARPRP